MQRPRLKRTVELIALSSGDVYLLQPSTGTELVVGELDPDGRRLLARLDGSASVRELNEAFGSGRVREALGQLQAFNLVEDANGDALLPDADRERLDRQLRYLGDMDTKGLAAPHYQARLRRSRVAMLGMGGLGSWAGYGLACCGVGELILIDGDVVEASNLNRQILYCEGDIGRLKVEVAAEALARFNRRLRLKTLARRLASLEAVREAIAGADLVVNGADWPAHDIERWVNRACFEAEIPFITMSHAPPVARVGPLYVPGSTGCFACQEARYRREYPLYDEVVAARRAVPSAGATLGPVCAFVGGQVALEVLHHLTGLCPPATAGVARIYDLRTMTVTGEPVVREPDCIVCSSGALEREVLTPRWHQSTALAR